MRKNKGQGTLEYLLILAAILAIAVVVVVVAQSILSPAPNTSVARAIELPIMNNDKYSGVIVDAPIKLTPLCGDDVVCFNTLGYGGGVSCISREQSPKLVAKYCGNESI
jgi:hypothetical protein